MAEYGLEVFNNAGVKTLGIYDRITRYVTTVTVSVNPKSTTNVTVPGMTTDGTWAVAPTTSSVLAATIGTGIVAVHNPTSYSALSCTYAIFRF